jgi:hypothetical protein
MRSRSSRPRHPRPPSFARESGRPKRPLRPGASGARLGQTHGYVLGERLHARVALGTQFSSSIAHLTSAGPTEYASDISGVSSTTLTIGGPIGVAAIGALYLASAPAAAQITPRTPSQSRPACRDGNAPDDPQRLPSNTYANAEHPHLERTGAYARDRRRAQPTGVDTVPSSRPRIAARKRMRHPESQSGCRCRARGPTAWCTSWQSRAARCCSAPVSSCSTTACANA